jgi:uncharacterized membrane protein YqhA
MFGRREVFISEFKKNPKTQTKELGRANARNFKQKFYIH